MLSKSECVQLIFSPNTLNPGVEEIENLCNKLNPSSSTEDLLLLLQFLSDFCNKDKNVDIVLNSGVILIKLSYLIAKCCDNEVKQKSFLLLTSVTKFSLNPKEHNKIEVCIFYLF
jgi:hypothetical protein